MKPLCIRALIAVAALAYPAVSPSQAADRAPANLNAISLEVAALQTLHDLNLSPAQVAALTKLAREANPKPVSKTEGTASPAYAKALGDLRVALASGNDDRISAAREKLDAILEKEEVELDIAVEVTDEARERARPVVLLLRAPQAAAVIAASEINDPADLLIDGLEVVRGLPDTERAEEIKHLVQEIAWLAAGRKEEAAERIRTDAARVLEKAAGIQDDAAFRRERVNLEREARDAVGPVSPVAVIGHALEGKMAELLSNPRLVHALTVIKTRPTVRGKKP